MARLQSTVVAPVNGVLCWDLFDFLNRPGAQALGAFLTAMLAPGARFTACSAPLRAN